MSDQSDISVLPATRDEDYYFPDGNIVLLVGGGLFKIHSSLLTQESETFRDMLSLPGAQHPSGELPKPEETAKEGSCDENPIIIPEVTHVSFRRFLFIFYGRPSNSKFVSTMTDTTKTTENHTLANFHRYFDIADLSHRFAAPRLEAWALGQLKGLSGSISTLSKFDPVEVYQVRALAYARIIDDKKLERQLLKLVELSYSYVLPGNPTRLLPPATVARLQSLLVMFKHPNLQKDHPSLFGFIFCATLSLGSQFWLNEPSLSREDRVKLLSAHVHLTPLPVSKLGLDWIEGTLPGDDTHGGISGLQSCDQCDFRPVWEQIFSTRYYKQLKERQNPLGGVISLSLLAVKRIQFTQAIAEVDVNCAENCKERFSDFVYEKVDHVFELFAGFYKDVE